MPRRMSGLPNEMTGQPNEMAGQAGNAGNAAAQEVSAPSLGDPKMSAGEHDLLAGLRSASPQHSFWTLVQVSEVQLLNHHVHSKACGLVPVILPLAMSPTSLALLQ